MDREEWLDTKASLAGHWKMVPFPQQLSVPLLKPTATVAIMLKGVAGWSLLRAVYVSGWQ
jgi:hypothetical protein